MFEKTLVHRGSFCRRGGYRPELRERSGQCLYKPSEIRTVKHSFLDIRMWCLDWNVQLSSVRSSDIRSMVCRSIEHWFVRLYN
jgi:hypothetical protein